MLAIDIEIQSNSNVIKDGKFTGKLWGAIKDAEKIINKFEHGKLFEISFIFKKGLDIGVLAGTNIAGKTLTLKDIAIYAVDSKAANVVGSKEFFALKNQVIKLVKQQGFEKVILQGQRSLTSTSANKGHVIDMVIDLTKK